MTFTRKIFLLILILLTGTFAFGAKVAITNGLTHEEQVTPGDRHKGMIELVNSSDTETSVRLYQTDYWFSCTGENRYDKPGTLPRSNASWITLTETFITLKAHESRSVEYETTVPDKDTLRGTYWSVIMVEAIGNPDTLSFQKKININTITRYAVQVITHIGETGSSDLQFLNVGIKKEGNTMLEVDISNTGERALRPEPEIEIFDSAGVSQGVVKTDRKRIFPGTSARFQLDMSKIKPGNYTGVLVANCDEDHVYGTNVKFDL